MRVKEITSPQNPIIKELSQLLAKSKARREQGRFLVEGFREVSRALCSGYHLESLLYRPEFIPTEDELSARLAEDSRSFGNVELTKIRETQHLHCSANVFAKVAYRVEVPNVVAVFKTRRLENLSCLAEGAKTNPLILILEGIEKPGNLGAILRSADAFGVDGVILVNSHADLEHPNTIRNSLGAALALEVISLELDDCCHRLNQAGVPLYVTHLSVNSVEPRTLKLDQACALVLGAEACGASAQWFDRGAQATLIPMAEERVVDSLNVSVAAAVMLYEASRQRRDHR